MSDLLLATGLDLPLENQRTAAFPALKNMRSGSSASL
jgi:hypothetical protein